VGFSFIPKEEKFFDLLEEAVENAIKAATTFRTMVENWSLTSPDIQKIRDLEHEGDRMTHEVIDKLNRTFITPIDREDILALTSEIDDVVDILQATTDRMQIYRIGQITPHLKKMADVVVKSTEVIGKAVKSLRDLSHSRRTLDFCIEANRLENEGDTLLKEALRDLFADQQNPNVLEVLKWKEIYEATEYATDKCEDIANVIEGIVVKNA
jgi:predicted phosphate transport protein (TIGR00153 family)